jgi:UDP-N-acetylmuramate dehydrogenase
MTLFQHAYNGWFLRVHKFMIASVRIIENHPLRTYTAIGIGGQARYFAAAASMHDLQQAVSFARERQVPVYVLGRGSNVLIQDDVVQGVVVMLSGAFKEMSFQSTAGTVTAGAGVPLIKLGVALARRGYAGCAYMGVIPGSVGGAVRMNAGTGQGQEIASHLTGVRVFDPVLMEERCLEQEQLQFSYRTSILSVTPQIVLEAVFKLPEEREAVPGQALADIKELFARRRAAHPRSRCTFGSTFKNPAGAEHSAGWYLEQAGMKGMHSGGAMVPHEHANWIINTGGARSDNVKELIETGRSRVLEKFGIALEREVVYLPQDMAG